MVPVEDSSGSSNSRLPSATLAAVGGLPAGLGTKAGRANLAFRAARGCSVDCCACAVGAPDQWATSMSAANPTAALAANAVAMKRQPDSPPRDGEGFGAG